MANRNLQQLQAENEQLRAENRRLRQSTAVAPPSNRHKAHLLRTAGAIIFAVLAVALLIAGNLLFWAGNTLVKNDRFDQAVSPIIRNTTVQQAVAKYTTNQLYANVDVTSVVQDALPPRAEFLAPTIAEQLRGQTQSALQKVLARPEFQDRWNKLQSKSHARFIDTVKRSGGDGVINLNELYQQLSGSLKDTKLSFLAGKQLPDKVGDVQVASGDGIAALHRVIVHIDAWRTLAVLLFVLCGIAAVYLARRRRRMVVLLATYCALGLLATLIALRITREIIAGKVDAQYTEAVRQVAQIVLHPLVVQTATIMIAFALVAIVAWLTGGGRGARYVQDRVRLLLAGKLHSALFGERENALTRWIGRHKRLLQWTVVVIVAVLMLITRLTPIALLWYAVATLVLVLAVELLGAPIAVPAKR